MNGPATAPATDHRGLDVLSFDDCLDRLRRTHLGRIAFVSAGESVILPVNHALDGDMVVFRTKPGSKMDIAVASGNVAYEIDGYDDTLQTGWSVLVKGTAEVVYEATETARYDGLGLRSWADPAATGQWVRIRPVEVTGREIGF